MFTFPAPSSVLLLSLLLGICLAQSPLPLPLPNGAYNTTLATMELVDHDRLDPLSNVTEPRAVMISLFRPVESCAADQLVNYSSAATAAVGEEMLAVAGVPKGSLQRLKLLVCEQKVFDNSRTNDFPVVLFSPGLSMSRTWYNSIAQWVASHGYHVVSIDHPYDASIVEFPDGRAVYGTIDSIDEMPKSIQVRAQDAMFVLDQLTDASVVRELIPGATGGLDVQRSAVFGHSLGGATAATAMLDDSRVAGGLNFDGSVYGPAMNHDQRRPFLLFGTGVHNQTNDSTWETFWSHLHGWKKGLLYRNAEHLSYTDGPMFMKLMGVDPDDVPPGFDLQMGSVDGLRNMEVLTAYAVAFLDFILKKQGEGILNQPSSKYSEIQYDFFDI